jgi:cytochrome c peroxidase
MGRRDLWAALALVTLALGCGAQPETETVESVSSALTTSSLARDLSLDPVGVSETVSPTAIDLSAANPFFHDFGTNGRVCGTCHQEAFGWTISPLFALTRLPGDPLFVFDGSDCLPPGVPNHHRFRDSTQMLSKALIRIEIGVPATADYTLTAFVDPLRCPTPPSAASLRMYRRPLPAANTAFLSTVMWDGRENVNKPNNTVALIQADLANQSNDATLGHAQAAAPLPDADRQAIVGFETNLFNGQRVLGLLPLDLAGAHGGGTYLHDSTLPSFFIGINDVLGCAIPGSCEPGKSATFSSVIFDVYAAWEAKPPTPLAASIGRGEVLFNTRSFPIDNVRGINGPDDTLGLPSPFMGFCGTCHDSPNVGNHSTSLPIDIGITTADPVGGLDVARLPRYTFTQNGTGRTITVTDPGRGLISGRFVDLGKTKGPNLRGLAARPPFFHNGSAKDLPTLVDFYDVRFHIGFSDQEKRDLVAFLSAL